MKVEAIRVYYYDLTVKDLEVSEHPLRIGFYGNQHGSDFSINYGNRF